MGLFRRTTPVSVPPVVKQACVHDWLSDDVDGCDTCLKCGITARYNRVGRVFDRIAEWEKKVARG